MDRILKWLESPDNFDKATTLFILGILGILAIIEGIYFRDLFKRKK